MLASLAFPAFSFKCDIISTPEGQPEVMLKCKKKNLFAGEAKVVLFVLDCLDHPYGSVWGWTLVISDEPCRSSSLGGVEANVQTKKKRLNDENQTPEGFEVET